MPRTKLVIMSVTISHIQAKLSVLLSPLLSDAARTYIAWQHQIRHRHQVLAVRSAARALSCHSARPHLKPHQVRRMPMSGLLQMMMTRRRWRRGSTAPSGRSLVRA